MGFNIDIVAVIFGFLLAFGWLIKISWQTSGLKSGYDGRLKSVEVGLGKVEKRNDDRWGALAKKEHENRIANLEKSQERLEQLIEKQEQRELQHAQELNNIALQMRDVSKDLKYLRERFEDVLSR